MLRLVTLVGFGIALSIGLAATGRATPAEPLKAMDRIEVAATGETVAIASDELGVVKVNVTEEVTTDFDMIGLLWETGVVEHLWLQVRTSTSARWGEWIEVAVDADHSPDSGIGRSGSEPVYTGEAIGFRFAIIGEPKKAEAMVLNTGSLTDSGPGIAPLAAPEPGGTTNPPAPSWAGASFVRSRSLWDTNSCRREGAVTSFSSAKAIVVHHTAATNDYLEADVPGIIAGHCNFHVNGRGWDDIGYNFLVDRFGGVWEGRTGSKTSPVQGAHTAGFNSQTQGVAMLGNFDSAAPSAETIGGLKSILNWLTGWHSISPSGSVSLTAGSTAIGFEEGESVVIPTIVGHRDLGSTSCPGGIFYATLATLRTQISPVGFGYVPSQLRCDGRPVTIFGTPGNDLIYGTEGSDVIHGIFGNDWIYGLQGDDVMCGNSGNDVLIGGGGYDRLFGDAGADSCGGEFLSGCEAQPNDEIFFYRTDGLFRYYDVTVSGYVGSPILAGSGYTAGWDSIAAIDLDGDGEDEMFFYRDDGLFRFYDINESASLTAPILAGSGYTEGWDSIVAIDLDGDGEDEMFFYRDDGLFRFYDVNSDGTLPAPFHSGTGYTTGWDSIVAIDLDGDGEDEMFFYREDGLFRFYDVTADGFLPAPLLAGAGYTHDWTTIASVDLDGDQQDEMFFYRDDGLFRYYHIREDGNLPSPLLAGSGYTTGWDIVTAVELNSKP